MVAICLVVFLHEYGGVKWGVMKGLVGKTRCKLSGAIAHVKKETLDKKVDN